MMRDLQHFNWNEAFNNSKGKTDIRLVSGFITIMVGCLLGIIGTYLKYGDALIASGVLVTAGSGLLGIGRFTKDKEIDLLEPHEKVSEEVK